MIEVDPVIEPLIERLHANGRLRVWSLIVSILGDVAFPRGGRMPMRSLLDLTEALRIDAGAVRTALSRLAKEGWVESLREGRNTSYRFGPEGTAQFGPAASMIYAPFPLPQPDRWLIAVLHPQKAQMRVAQANLLRAQGALILGHNIAIWTRGAPSVSDLAELGHMAFEADSPAVPHWVRKELATTEALNRFGSFIDAFSGLPAQAPRMSPFDAMLARILLLHDWRPLALRDALLPDKLQPMGWPGNWAHNIMADCYRALVPVSERYWDTPTSDSGQEILASRFRPDTGMLP